MRILAYLVIVLSFPWSAFAGEQWRVTDHLLINGGLANNYVRDICHDDYGRIWIATESGLNSFDGVLYSNYNTSNAQLGSNMVNSLYYDKNSGLLWIGTYGNGISTLDVRTGESRLIDIPSIPISNVYDIEASSDGILYFIGIRHIVRYNPKSGQFSLLYEAKDGVTLRYATCDKSGRLFVTTTTPDLICHDDASNKTMTLDNALSGLTFINNIRSDDNGTLWIATRNGVQWKKTGMSSFEYFLSERYAGKTVYDIMPLDDNKIILLTNFGVFIENLHDNTCNMADFHGLQYNYNMVTVHRDESGNIWMGSDGGGIYFISKVRSLFDVVSQKKTWCVRHDTEGVCWFGGEGVVISINPNGTVKEYPLRYPGIDKGYVLSIEVENERHLLLAAYQKLFRFDKRTGKIVEITTGDGASINAISFYRDYDGTIWTSAMDGVYILRKGKISKDRLLSSQLGNQMTNGIRRDRQSKIWVATYDAGAFLFDKHGKLMRRINQRNGFFANSVHHLYMDKDFKVWLATPDGIGLIKDTRQPDSISVIGYSQGLKDPFIRAIQEDPKGNVWVSTNNSLSMLDGNTGSVINYGKSDGLPITNFTGGITILPSGKLYVTSLEGICSLSLTELENSGYQQRLHIYKCCSFDTDDSRDPLPIKANGKGIFSLDYSQNNFRIYYCIDNLALTKRMEYSYMVKGKDAKWHPVNLNYISFREMTPGKYTIVVRARLYGQDWNDECQDEVTVVISKPFWLKWYAFVCYLILIAIAIVWFFVRYRQRIMIKNKMEMQRVKDKEYVRRNEERIQFFTNITHELKTPISLLVGPVESLLESKTLSENDKEKVGIIDNSSKRLHHLVEQILKFRRLESGKYNLTVEKGDLAALVLQIGNEFKAANTNDEVEYKIEIPEQPLPDIYFDREAITTIINNLMTNAVKYTLRGRITLRIESESVAEKNYTRISVVDTGCGIAVDRIPDIFNKFYQIGGRMQAEGTGIGLSIVKSLAESHKTEITVESNIGLGSTFSFMLDNGETYPDCLHKEAECADRSKPIISDATCGLMACKDKPIVLIVEDNADMNNFIASSLSNDYYIIQTSNGKEGLDAALSQVPDVIVSDIMMPVMDGNEMLGILKNDLRTSHIPVILLTAKTSVEEQTEGYENGADIYITKPFSVKMLRSCVKNTIIRRKHFVEHIGNNNSALPAADREEYLQKLSPIDRSFLRDLDRVIDENISSRSLTTTMLAVELKVSQTTLYRKMKALKGLSANEYIRKRRILHAICCMTEQRQNISEAAFNSGFNDIKYFRTCFREEIGVNPSEYIKNNEEHLCNG